MKDQAATAPALQLDHVTIVTAQLENLRQLLCSVVGLRVGPRPPFGISGHWLYAGGRPVIHLIGQAAAPNGTAASRIDHLGLRIDSAQQWSSLLARVRDCGIPHQLAGPTPSGERQLFLSIAPGVIVELVTAAPAGTAADPIENSISTGDQ